jgi:hypothetical protein
MRPGVVLEGGSDRQVETATREPAHTDPPPAPSGGERLADGDVVGQRFRTVAAVIGVGVMLLAWWFALVWLLLALVR